VHNYTVHIKRHTRRQYTVHSTQLHRVWFVYFRSVLFTA